MKKIKVTEFTVEYIPSVIISWMVKSGYSDDDSVMEILNSEVKFRKLNPDEFCFSPSVMEYIKIWIDQYVAAVDQEKK